MKCEMLVRVADKGKSGDPYVDVTHLQSGEVVVAVTQEDARRVWDEMLANGRVTKEQHAASKRADGTHRWPWGTAEVASPEHRIIETEMEKVEADSFLAPEPGDRAVDPMLRRRLYRIDLAALPPKQGVVTEVPVATVRAAKQDAPKEADPGVL